MMNVFKEILATGLGAVFLTKDKVEEMVGKLVEEGSVNKEEAEELMDNMIKKAQQQREKISNKVKTELKSEFAKAGFSKREDVEDLEQQVEKLELHIKSLEEEIKELKNDSSRGTDSDS
jgi:polyhydroxyalkanoate synthesis regulator phasin